MYAYIQAALIRDIDSYVETNYLDVKELSSYCISSAHSIRMGFDPRDIVLQGYDRASVMRGYCYSGVDKQV